MCGSGSASVAVGSGGAAAGRAEAATHPALDAVTPPWQTPSPPRRASPAAAKRVRSPAGDSVHCRAARCTHACSWLSAGFETIERFLHQWDERATSPENRQNCFTSGNAVEPVRRPWRWKRRPSGGPARVPARVGTEYAEPRGKSAG